MEEGEEGDKRRGGRRGGMHLLPEDPIDHGDLHYIG